MSDTNEAAPRGDEERDTTPEASRRKVERLIDDIAAQSFPASDPPAWGVAASRLEEAKKSAEQRLPP